MKNRFFLLAAFIWGLCEGLFFFLIPDILLCYCSLRGWRVALFSTLNVLLGSMIAAILLYTYMDYTHGSAYHGLHQLWLSLPGFREKMALVAATHIEHGGGRGFLYGPSSGIPYRVFLLEAWQQRVPLSQVLLWTPLARLERIVVAPIATLLLHKLALWALVKKSRCTSQQVTRALSALIAAYWVCIYIWYWGKLVPSLYGS